MSFVICTLPNASDLINGIEFEEHKEGKISKAAVPAEVAEVFAQIDGYKVVDAKGAKAAAKKEEKPAGDEGEEAAAKAAAEAAEAEAAAKAKAKK